MEIIIMIMSGLALLDASVSLAIAVKEKKRNEKQRADYVDDMAKRYQEELHYRTAASEEMGKL